MVIGVVGPTRLCFQFLIVHFIIIVLYSILNEELGPASEFGWPRGYEMTGYGCEFHFLASVSFLCLY